MLHRSPTVAFENLLPWVLARGAQTSLTNCGSCLFCMLRGLVQTVPTRTPISSRSMLHSGVVRTATFEALIYSKQSRQILSSNFLLKKKKRNLTFSLSQRHMPESQNCITRTDIVTGYDVTSNYVASCCGIAWLFLKICISFHCL